MKKKYKILIVDDDDFSLNLLGELFTDTSYEVTLVNNPFEAYEMIENQPFEIVICDIIMPGMDGLTLLEKIKDFNGMIQVIMLTADVTVTNIIKAFRKGANDIFFKPIGEAQENLMKAVDAAATKLDRVNTILRELEGRQDGH